MSNTETANMNRLPCSLSNSILGLDLEMFVRRGGKLQKLIIAETPEGYYLVVHLNCRGDKERYLTTRRERTRPRLFRNLNTLNDYLKETFPAHDVILMRNQTLPEKGLGDYLELPEEGRYRMLEPDDGFEVEEAFRPVPRVSDLINTESP